MLFRRGRRCIRELSGGRGGGRMRLNRELSAWTRLNLKQHNNIITNIICLNYISHFTVGCGDLLLLVSIHLGSPGIVNKFALIHSSSYLYTLDFYLRSIICIACSFYFWPSQTPYTVVYVCFKQVLWSSSSKRFAAKGYSNWQTVLLV